jgi:hypothetical protein
MSKIVPLITEKNTYLISLDQFFRIAAVRQDKIYIVFFAKASSYGAEVYLKKSTSRHTI